MEENALNWLLNWYASQCDGYWEHLYGVILETNSVPGWSFSVSLAETELESEFFKEINEHMSESNWLRCFVHNNEFIGRCSPSRVLSMLQIFLEWSEPYSDIELCDIVNPFGKDEFPWLLEWYQDCCDKNLSSKGRIMISTLDNPGWNLDVDLHGTGLETDKFSFIQVERSETDWYHCFVRDNEFHGPCGLYNLFEVLNIFKDFSLSQKLS